MTKTTPAIRIALAAGCLVLAFALVPVALAARGGGKAGGSTSGGGGSSLSLVMVTDLNGNGLPNYGDTVTFHVSTSASYPNVQLLCWQNGALVFDQTAGFYPTYLFSQDYTFTDYRWPGGAANCTATLTSTGKNGATTTLVTSSFNVGA